MEAVSKALPIPTQKRCEPQLFVAALGHAVDRWKVLDLGSLNMQFQLDGPKDEKNYSSLNFFT